MGQVKEAAMKCQEALDYWVENGFDPNEYVDPSEKGSEWWLKIECIRCLVETVRHYRKHVSYRYSEPNRTYFIQRLQSYETRSLERILDAGIYGLDHS